MMTVFVVVLIILVVLVVLEKMMASKNTYVESRRQPEEVRKQVESLFNSKLNRFSMSGTQLLITPKLRKDAPTLHIDITAGNPGSKTHMWATVVAEKRAFLPWIPKHGLYIWRKQLKIAAAIRKAD